MSVSLRWWSLSALLFHVFFCGVDAIAVVSPSEGDDTKDIAAAEEAGPGVLSKCCLHYDLVFTSKEALEDVGVVIPPDGGRAVPSVFVNEVAVPPLTSLMSPGNLKRAEAELAGQKFRVSEAEEYVLFRRDALHFVYGMCDQGGLFTVATIESKEGGEHGSSIKFQSLGVSGGTIGAPFLLEDAQVDVQVPADRVLNVGDAGVLACIAAGSAPKFFPLSDDAVSQLPKFQSPDFSVPVRIQEVEVLSSDRAGVLTLKAKLSFVEKGSHKVHHLLSGFNGEKNLLFLGNFTGPRRAQALFVRQILQGSNPCFLERKDKGAPVVLRCARVDRLVSWNAADPRKRSHTSSSWKAKVLRGIGWVASRVVLAALAYGFLVTVCGGKLRLKLPFLDRFRKNSAPTAPVATSTPLTDGHTGKIAPPPPPPPPLPPPRPLNSKATSFVAKHLTQRFHSKQTEAPSEPRLPPPPTPPPSRPPSSKGTSFVARHLPQRLQPKQGEPPSSAASAPLSGSHATKTAESSLPASRSSASTKEAFSFKKHLPLRSHTKHEEAPVLPATRTPAAPDLSASSTPQDGEKKDWRSRWLKIGKSSKPGKRDRARSPVKTGLDTTPPDIPEIPGGQTEAAQLSQRAGCVSGPAGFAAGLLAGFLSASSWTRPNSPRPLSRTQLVEGHLHALLLEDRQRTEPETRVLLFLVDS